LHRERCQTMAELTRTITGSARVLSPLLEWNNGWRMQEISAFTSNFPPVPPASLTVFGSSRADALA
jgi:hypothetical protein